MKRRTINFGWVPDLPDQRDFKLQIPEITHLPSTVDLRKLCPQVYDQGNLGSCTANALAAAVGFELHKQKAPDFMPSRLFIYYNERVIENSVNEDAGAMIRDGVKSLHKLGVCNEDEWKYNIDEFATTPSSICYTDALNHQVTSYHRVIRSLSQMKQCLAAGYPFVFGFSVYESFESDLVAKTGHVNMPKDTEQLLGGHAVLAVGYNDKSKRFLVRNSWGQDWGLKGYFSMPYDYLLNPDLSDDFWTIRLVE